MLQELAQACSTEERMNAIGGIRIRKDCPFRYMPKQELLDIVELLQELINL